MAHLVWQTALWLLVVVVVLIPWVRGMIEPSRDVVDRVQEFRHRQSDWPEE